MTTRYVATTGNDSTGTGAIGAPWATLLKALNNAATSDTIQLRGGTYANTFKNGRDTVVIENYPGENVVIQRTSIGGVLQLENSRNITIRKNGSGGTFTIRSTVTGNGQSGGGIFMYYNSAQPGFTPTNILIDGIIVSDIAGYGIQIVDASAVTVQHVDVSHTATGIRFRRVTGSSFIQDGSAHHTDRMIISDATPNNDNGGVGIALDDGDGITVRRMLIYENHAPSVEYEVDGGAITFFGNANCVVEDCIAYNNQSFIETGTSNATTRPMDGNVIRRNLIYGRSSYRGTFPGVTPSIYHRAGTNLHVYNNTFDLDDGHGFIIHGNSPGTFGAPISGLKIKNNVIVNHQASNNFFNIFNVTGATGIEIDYNLLFNSAGGSNEFVTANDYGGSKTGTQLTSWRSASPFSDHDVWNSDPLFVNRAARDYTLQGGSPAIDAGVVISGTTDGYIGAAPDLGAHEAAGTPPGAAPDPPVISGSNGYNTNGTVTIAGTSDDGNVELFDGATSKGSKPVVGGAWSFTLTVSDGTHTYTAYTTSGTDTSTVSNSRVITVDTTRPTIVSTSPTNGATGVAVGANVVITFSEAMDPATITTASFRVERLGVPVAGSISMSSGDTVATFNPSPDLLGTANGNGPTGYNVELDLTIKDVAGNTLVGGLPPGGGDVTAPTISGVVVSGITTTSATISWTTNEAATGVVEYGSTTTYGQTTGATSSGTSHSRTLSGLMPATPVHFRIRATDTAGNLRLDGDRVFTTQNTIPASTGVYGPAIAGDGKDNRPIGRSDDSHVAFRWHTSGGTITGFAFNQRFGPDQSNPGMGYSHGTGGTIRATIQGVNGSGFPDGNVLATKTFSPSNPHTDDETKSFLTFDSPATVSARDLVLVLDNTHADPTNNWMSANCFWVGTADSPRQPAFPDDKMAVLEKATFTSGAWRVKTDNTPVFDIVFADSHHEGQQFYSVVANTDLGSGSGTQGWVLNGTRRVRQNFTTGGTFQAAWLRVRRVSGSGSLTAYLGAATSSAASVDFIPASAYSSLTGGRWVRCPFSSPVTIGSGFVAFSSTAECVVMPIREIRDEFGQSPAWQSRGFSEGKAEKSTNSGSTWSDLYNGYTDAQCYLEPA